MRKQVKALIWASSVTAVATTGIFLGTHFYGKTDSAKGVKIKFVDDEKSNFLEYKMQLIDKSTGKEQVVGEYKPDGTIDGIKSSDWVKQYREKNNGADPIFRITKGFFKLNNEYVDAVSIDDWFEFAKWYLGYNGQPGHLAYGPESGAISTFEIVPGVNEMAGGGVVLGGRDSSNNEYDKITFYPDSFFGTFSLYDLGATYFDRLLEPMFPSGEKDANGNPMPMEFTYEEAQDAIKLINKVNKFNGQYLSKSEHIDPKVLEYWNNSKWGAQSFTNNGSNTPAPYAIQKSSIKTVNGQAVQYYTFYAELFTRKDGAATPTESGDSLLRKVAKTFPSVLQTVDSPYIELDKTTGVYELKNGVHKEIPFGKRIGLPYILKAAQGDAFKGFGIDFLRYVAIHEYGHHLTLVMAQDNSEGGVTAGGWNGRAAPTATNLYNIDEMNRYFAARSSGIRAVKTDAYNRPVDGWRDYIESLLTNKIPTEAAALKRYNDYKAFNTSYYAFAIPTSAADSTSPLVINHYRFEKIEDVSGDQAYSRAFRLTFDELKAQYVEAAKTNDGIETSVYNALLQNSFDTMSGTLNPASEEGPFNFVDPIQLTNDGTALMNRMTGIWSIMNREFTSYEKTLVQNILYSTVRGLDANKWPSSEKQNLQTYLNFLYKNPEDFVYPEKLEDRTVNGVTTRVDVSGEEMVKDFFNFYDNPKFIDAWFAKGSFRDDYLKTLYSTEPGKGLSLAKGGWNPNTQYAFNTHNPKQIDGDTTQAFYDATDNNHKWTTFEQVILNWKDGSGKNNLFTHEASATKHDFSYDADQEFKVWNPYAGYDPALKRQLKLDLHFALDVEKYKDAEGNGVVITTPEIKSDGSKIFDISKMTNPTDAQKNEAWAVLEEKVKHVLNTVAHIMWGTNSAKPDADGRVPFKSDIDGIFSDYTYSFAEVMTRDFVQMTFAEGTDLLKNVDPMIGISSSDTSFEYYIHSDLSAMYATHDENGKILPEHFFTQTDSSLWIKPIAQAIRTGDQSLIDSILGTGSDALTAADINLIEKMDGGSSDAGILVPAYGIEPYNSVFGHDKFLSNGFETDHAYRTSSNWELYNADGTARVIKPEDNIHIYGPDGKTEATTWAQAYWYFILGEYGVGTRSVSASWRDTEMDKNHMYGYIEEKYGDQVKYLRFHNKETNTDTFIEVNVQNTNNLFYLTHQGNKDTRHDLHDEGYVSWTTDKEAVGLYLNSALTQGTYEVEFVDNNKNEINGLHFNLGEGVTARNYVAENGKFYRTAPTYFERELNSDGTATGKTLFVVKPQFNV